MSETDWEGDELCDVGMHVCSEVSRTLDDGRTVCPDCDDESLDEERGHYSVREIESGFVVVSPDGRTIAAMFYGRPELMPGARKQAEAACAALNESFASEEK